MLSLTLADKGGVGAHIFHAIPNVARNFYGFSARPGHGKNLMTPYFAAYGRDVIDEGEGRFWIPGGGPGFELSRFGEVVGSESDDGEQAEQGRGGAKNCLVGLLTLGFDTKMGADFLERDFDLPTTSSAAVM